MEPEDPDFPDFKKSNSISNAALEKLDQFISHSIDEDLKLPAVLTIHEAELNNIILEKTDLGDKYEPGEHLYYEIGDDCITERRMFFPSPMTQLQYEYNEKYLFFLEQDGTWYERKVMADSRLKDIQVRIPGSLLIRFLFGVGVYPDRHSSKDKEKGTKEYTNYVNIFKKEISVKIEDKTMQISSCVPYKTD